ncbi:uncharacterized protein A1O9_01671 [Exophiala aquamarina CBS 119918]|uniref:Methyltransferase type 11 domain-containing protein n=1 Tax=Exophiala aquamarina CBS 119918 TaxID=1182545 RepID=A0A072PWF2_9EURO|nr:uncharacterized protein A1O9_01671 [Exophiala aquamarina CBS 119918]KEF63693.1 hypothetical protein A1O9_01671 [Exophiala aquamarina CBS 119918]
MDSSLPPIRSYTPQNPDGPFPYSKADLTPMDAGSDQSFYTTPRFVTHIDDNAIINLRKYYAQVIPRKGRVLDFCSSWISHYPADLANEAAAGEVEVLGTGMNKSELSKNPILKAWSVQDLNEEPEMRLPGEGEGRKIDASTCVVSIDYLTRPVEVLSSIRQQTDNGGKVHLIISNRCFPAKVVGRWLKVDEEARLNMVGDYLWWSGWRNIEIQTLVDGSWTTDPLWVVRGENPET